MADTVIKVVLVEDDPAHAEAIRRTLESTPNFAVHVAGSIREYRECAPVYQPDIVIMDLNLPDGRSTDVLKESLDGGRYPIIVMTSFGNEQSAVEAMKSGAIDYIVKSPDVFTGIQRTIDRALREWNLLREHERAQEALRESEAKQRAMISNIADVIAIIDPKGTITYKSENIEKYFGWKPADLIGLQYTVTVHPDDLDRVNESFAYIMAHENATTTVEYRYKVKNGSFRMIHLTAMNLVHDPNINGVLATYHDITDQRRLEQQLIQAQKLEGVGTLAGGIAHDFNNLLAMVLGSAELLQRQLPDHSDLRKYVDRIIDASERGTSISRQLLIFSRPDQAELKQVSLSQSIAELQEMLKHFLPKSITIETSMEGEDGVILGDAGQIHQALLNLSLNAGDAMTNNGTLRIRQFPAPSDIVRRKFPFAQAVPYCGISVSDTGMGMGEAILAKIFDPFFSTKERGKGTGLGLAIVHGIVKNHNGFIDVQSAPGEGTTFTLYFPCIQRQEPGKPRSVDAPGTTQNGTILVVDDEQLLRETLFEFLTGSGYSVHTASNGTEALELYARHCDTIDLVITDLGMPVMGGEELERKLRAINRDVKIVVSSGYLDGTTKEHLLELGIRDVLTKPFKLRDVQTAIHAVLGSGA